MKNIHLNIYFIVVYYYKMSDNDNIYIRPKEASNLLHVTTKTLNNWEKDNKIKCVRTHGNHRRFLKSDIDLLMSEASVPLDNKLKICYCRVSTSSQKDDLDRQIEYFKLHYPNHKIVKDIASGLNYKRKGFNFILDEAIKGNIFEVVITHKDRLCRFGFECIERIISKSSDGIITIINSKKTTQEQELVDDVLSIITVFSSKIYGRRSHTIKKKIKDCLDDPDKMCK